jgi:hypothetical protein
VVEIGSRGYLEPATLISIARSSNSTRSAVRVVLLDLTRSGDSVVSFALSLWFPILDAELQPLKLRSDTRFPDSLFRILGHAHRITCRKRRLFVVQAAAPLAGSR